MHWGKQDTKEKSAKNAANRNSDRGGKGVFVHNLGACSMSSKEDQLVSYIYLKYIFKNIFTYLLINFVFRLKQMAVIPLIMLMS